MIGLFIISINLDHEEIDSRLFVIKNVSILAISTNLNIVVAIANFWIF